MLVHALGSIDEGQVRDEITSIIAVTAAMSFVRGENFRNDVVYFVQLGSQLVLE